MFDLNQFTSPADPRVFMQKPFNYAGKTWAINGHIALQTDLDEQYQAYDQNHSLLKFIDDFILVLPNLEFKPLPNLSETIAIKTCHICNVTKTTKTIICDECGGDGFILFNTNKNTYKCDCESCDGDGSLMEPDGSDICLNCHGLGIEPTLRSKIISIDPCEIDERYYLLINSQPGVEYAPSPLRSESDLIFKLDNQFGIVMGMRKP